jgi:hypothetical protein
MNPLFIISIVLSLCAPAKHVCRWDLCPYKGITMQQASNAVMEYTGEACTEAYIIDMLHIKYPTLDTDQLDSLLIAREKTFSKFTITH